MSESYEMVSVSGGKFHRLADPAVDEVSAFRPSVTACGRTVTPSNYFDTEADALHYCGDRREYLCSQCAPSWWSVEVSPNGVEHTLVRGRCVTCGRSHDEWSLS